MGDPGLIKFVQHIVNLTESKDKIGYLKEETDNVTNLKIIIIAARKILESKDLKYKVLRGTVTLFSKFTGVNLLKGRTKISSKFSKKVNNSNINRLTLEEPNLIYMMQRLYKRHIDRDMFILLNMNFKSLTPELNSIVEYIAENYLELFLGMIDVISVDTTSLYNSTKYNGEFTELGKDIKNNPQELYNFSTLEKILNFVLNLVFPYSSEVYNNDDGTYPNVLEAIFSLLINIREKINVKLRENKKFSEDITIFKIISQKIEKSFETIMLSITDKNLKPHKIDNNSSRMLFKLLKSLDDGNKIPLSIIVSYYVKSILEAKPIRDKVRILYLEYLLNTNIDNYKINNANLNSLLEPQVGGQLKNKRTKKRDGYLTSYLVRNEELFDKINDENKLPYRMMEGILEGTDSKFIDEFMSLQTDNNNLCNIFYKKNGENYEYHNLRLLFGYTAIVMNNTNRKEINDVVSKLIKEKTSHLLRKSAENFKGLVGQSLRKYYYNITFNKDVLNLTNYREGMLSKYGFFRILSFLISISYASLDDSVLTKILNPGLIYKALKTKQKLEKNGVLQVDSIKKTNDIITGDRLLLPEVNKLVDFSLDSLVKILDRFLYSKHITLFKYRFKTDINRLESGKIRNILLFFLVYTNLNNMLNNVMKDDENAEDIFVNMDYSILRSTKSETNNMNSTKKKVLISPENQEEFDTIKQILFDKIATCFMFEKLYTFYDNFRLTNLKAILEDSDVNNKIKLFKKKELRLFKILFSNGNNYFDKNLEDNYINYINKFNKDSEQFNHRFLNIINYCLNYSFMVSFPLFEEVLEYHIDNNNLFSCNETREYLDFDLRQPKIVSYDGKDHFVETDDSVFFLKL